MHLNPRGTDAPAFGTLLGLALCTSSSGFSSVPFTLSSTLSVSKVSLGSVSHSSKLSGLSKYFSEQKNNVKLK